MSKRAAGETPFFSDAQYEGLMQCVRCGLCLPHCPTYRELGVETASPRGRLALMKAVADGVATPDADFTRHMHLCLDCRACETACPSGVPFGNLMEHARAKIEPTRRQSIPARFARFVGFRILLPSPRLLGLSAWGLRIAQALGLRALFRRSGLLARFWPRAADFEAMLPETQLAVPGARLPALVPPVGEMRARVALFTGCVMDALFPSVNRDTVEVLRRNGCEVIVPRGQGCCGALHVHEGLRAQGARLARRNLEAFGDLDVDAIVVNAAGCGSVLKEYASLLAGDEAESARAQRFAGRVRDVMELLGQLGLRHPGGELRQTIVHDAPCHLLHAQGVGRAPVELLRRIPGARVTEGPDSAFCCGSAGIYNITHPEVSGAMLDRKMQTLVPLDPDVIASGNPGCLMQLRLGASRWKLRAEVRHPVELLARAYRGGR